MSQFKEGDKAWICAVFTRTKARTKVTAVISEVTITKLFEDETCLVTDLEDVGIYCNVIDLFDTKVDALVDAVKGLHRWNGQTE